MVLDLRSRPAPRNRVLVTLFAATIAIAAHAQDKPADSELKMVRDSWNNIGCKFIAMAEDFPEGDDFKSDEIFIAAPPARVFQAISDPAQLQHLGDNMASTT